MTGFASCPVRLTVDDIERLIADSMDAIHRMNTRRRIKCNCGCGVIYLTAQAYFRHMNHPVTGGAA